MPRYRIHTFEILVGRYIYTAKPWQLIEKDFSVSGWDAINEFIKYRDSY